MTIEKQASLQVNMVKVQPLPLLVMHNGNMMDQQTDGPTHFSWSALYKWKQCIIGVYDIYTITLNYT